MKQIFFIANAVVGMLVVGIASSVHSALFLPGALILLFGLLIPINKIVIQPKRVLKERLSESAPIWEAIDKLDSELEYLPIIAFFWKPKVRAQLIEKEAEIFSDRLRREIAVAKGSLIYYAKRGDYPSFTKRYSYLSGRKPYLRKHNLNDLIETYDEFLEIHAKVLISALRLDLMNLNLEIYFTDIGIKGIKERWHADTALAEEASTFADSKRAMMDKFATKKKEIEERIEEAQEKFLN